MSWKVNNDKKYGEHNIGEKNSNTKKKLVRLLFLRKASFVCNVTESFPTASDLYQLFLAIPGIARYTNSTNLADFVLTVTFFQFVHLLLLFKSILPSLSQTPAIAYLTTAILSFLNLANTFFTLIKSTWNAAGKNLL